jgi:squalene cyclase
MAAEYMLLTHFLGVAGRRRWDKIVNHLRRQQLADGTWSIHDFINYHLYRDYFPLMALGRYLTFMRGGYFWAAGPRT